MIIFGGTGTLGQELMKRFSDSGEDDLTVFSRDEQKQKALLDVFPDVRFVLGDIRDADAVRSAMEGHKRVYHVAAMKHIDMVEANSGEAIKTNIIGSYNIAQAAIEKGVRQVVFSSSDKAVLPINIYGYTKALIERVYLGMNTKQNKTRFWVFRWGNVLGSRGSVLGLFAKTLREEKKVYITHAAMTRFWIPIGDAVTFMIRTLNDRYLERPDKVYFPPMKAAKVTDLAASVARVLGIEAYDTVVTRIGFGEKLHECLDSNHERCLRSDTSEQYTADELDRMVAAVL